MFEFKNLIGKDEHHLQDILNEVAKDGWGNPTNPTATTWNEVIHHGSDIVGSNSWVYWTQVVSRKIENG